MLVLLQAAVVLHPVCADLGPHLAMASGSLVLDRREEGGPPLLPGGRVVVRAGREREGGAVQGPCGRGPIPAQAGDGPFSYVPNGLAQSVPPPVAGVVLWRGRRQTV